MKKNIRRQIQHCLLRSLAFALGTFSVLAWAGKRVVHAEDSGKNPEDYLSSSFASDAGLPITDPLDTTFGIIQAFLQLLGLIGLILVIYGGFTLLLSAGNPEKIKKGRDIILWAVIGIIVVLSSYGILLYIDSITSKF